MDDTKKPAELIEKQLDANNSVMQMQSPLIDNRNAALYFEPFNNPREILKSQEVEKKTPSVFEVAARTFKDFNEIIEIQTALDKRNAFAVSPEPKVPEGWKSTDDRDLYFNVSSRYWDMIANAKSPEEQQARYNYALQLTNEDEYFEGAGALPNIIGKSSGFLAAMATSPSSYVPLAAGVKYGKAAKTIFQAAKVSALPLGATFALKNAALYAADPDKTAEDAAYDTLIQTGASMFLVGGMAGLGRGFEGFKMWDLRRVQEFAQKGIGYKFNLGKEGEILGYKAVAAEGKSVGADELKLAQEYADTAFKVGGLFYLPTVQKLTGAISPVFRGLTSKSGVIRSYVNRTADHDIETIAGKAHVPDAMPFEARHRFVQSEGIALGARLEGLRKAYNKTGFSADDEIALKELNSGFNKTDPLDSASFGNRVAYALSNDLTEGDPNIINAKNLIKDFFDKHWETYRQLNGFEEDQAPLATAMGYITQIHNRGAMQSRRSEWLEMATQELRRQDNIIASLNKPIDEIKKQISSTKKLIRQTGDEQYKIQLQKLRQERKRLKDELITELRDNPKNLILLQERNLLSSGQEKTLKALLEPTKKLKKEKAAKVKQIEANSKNIFILSEKMNAPAPKKAKQVDEKLKAKKHKTQVSKIEKLEKANEKLKAERDALERKILDEQARLNGLAAEGKIDKNLFRKDKEGLIHFKKIGVIPKFRKTYEDDIERNAEADTTWQSIINNDDATISSQSLAHITGIISENPSYARTVMLPQELLLRNNFLVTDLPRIVHNYANTIGKSNAYKQSLAGLGDDLSYDGVRKLLLQEQAVRRKNALDKAPESKREKISLKLDKTFKKEQVFLQKFTDTILGQNKYDRTVARWSSVMRNLAGATRLGFVPATQAQDTAAIAFKHGFIPFLRDGLGATLRTMNGLIKSKEGITQRKQWSVANIGLEHIRKVANNREYNIDFHADELGSTMLERGIDKMSHVANKLSGMVYIDNFNQKMTANVAQSRIMSEIMKFTNGKASAKSIKYLERYGINAEQWAKRFREQFETHDGHRGVFGGYQSNWADWTDKQAMMKMAQSINMAVADTIIKRGRVDMPFWMNGPAAQVVTQFMGWSFAAFNRFAVPIMQNPFQIQKAYGALLMMTISSFEVVSRKWARGEEVDLEDENFVAEAFANSAPTAMLYKSLMMANTFLRNDVIDKLKTDRYRTLTVSGLMMGPSAGIAQDWANLAIMIGSRDFNQKDIERAVRATPVINNWYTYQLISKVLEAATSGLPTKPQRDKE